MTISVCYSWRNKGLGSTLLKKLCTRLKREANCAVVTLHVKADNGMPANFNNRDPFSTIFCTFDTCIWTLSQFFFHAATALQFYKKHGFVLKEKIPNYYASTMQTILPTISALI
jgi:ribosomal protein S18 acetylase RimI-like enzyme